MFFCLSIRQPLRSILFEANSRMRLDFPLTTANNGKVMELRMVFQHVKIFGNLQGTVKGGGGTEKHAEEEMRR